jgi:hypothetical protein
MIIGLTGRKGSGKDTAAQVLIDEGFAHLKFASTLKAMTATFLREQGNSDDHIERMVNGDLKEVPSYQYIGGRTPREFQQWLGTEFGRNMIGQDIWIACAMNQANMHKNVVFTDVRFPNEVAAVQNAGGIVVRIERDVPTNQYSDHSSETMIDQLMAGIRIANDGSIGDLHDRLWEALDVYL